MEIDMEGVKKRYSELISEDLVRWIGQRKNQEIKILIEEGLTREEAWAIAKDFKIDA